jgi:opacity protein-like surface antigen
MIRLKMLVATLFATLLFASIGLAQELPRNEVSIQGTGFFTNNTTGKGIKQHTTDSGGLLVSYRYQISRWIATDGSYGYTRNTFQNSVPQLFAAGTGFDVQTDVHQITGALVLTAPRSVGPFKPFALAGGGVLNFDPVGNRNVGISVIRASGQNKGVFVYGAGTDINLSDYIAFRLEYRGLVYDRPDFGFAFLNSGRTTHTAQPSAGIVFRF